MGANPTQPPVFRGHVGQRIRFYRRQHELTQAALARKAGVNQSFLSEIERGLRNPSPTSMKAIAHALDVAPAVLIGPGPAHDTPQPLEMMEMPLFESIPVENPSEYPTPPETFPVLRHLWGRDRYCLRLTFDSMEPTLKPGDLVLVEYRPDANPEHVQGRICACLVDQVPTLKRVAVEKRRDGRIVILRGDNPETPATLIDETQDFSIQGVVTHLVSRPL
jgi:SOS-response transcriptional repressor LexA